MAGGIGGFLTGLGIQMGNDSIYGQQFQQNQAKTALMKADAEKDQMQAQQMQQQMQTQKSLGAFIQSQTQLDGADAANPLKQAQMYNKAAGLAASQGDFASAQEMTTLAKNATQDAQEAVVAQAKQQQVKKEDLANTADEYSADPTRDGAMALAKKAIAAGVNPATIPANLNSPEGQAWVNQQKLAGMDSKAKAEFVQKAADIKANRDMKWQEHEDNVSLRQAQMQQNAAFREDSLALRASEDAVRNADRADKAKNPQVIDIGGTKWERDPDMKLKGERNPTDPTLVKLGEPALTSSQKQGVSRGSFAAAEITRTLTQVQQLDPTIANSPFAQTGAHTPFDALVKVGTNELTPTQSQMLNVSAAGLGNQLASLDSSLGGRMAAGKSQEDLQAAAIRQSGESGFTAAYKLANAKELTLTALHHLPGNYKDTPEGKQQIEEAEKAVPFTTDDVLAAMRKDPKASDAQIRKLVSTSARLHSTLEGELKNAPDTGLPGASDAGTGSKLPPLPAGFKVDQ